MPRGEGPLDPHDPRPASDAPQTGKDVDDLLRELGEDRANLRERVKELRCLYAAEQALRDAESDWEAALRQVVDAIPAGFQFPERVGARVDLDGSRYATPGFRSGPWTLISDVVVDDEDVGRLEVSFLKPPPDRDEPFLPEEKELLESVASRLGQALRTRRQWEELRLLKKALDSAAHGVMITDRSGGIRWVNAAFTEITGYSLHDALERSPGSLFRSGEQNAEFYQDLWRTILRGEVWQGQLLNQRKDGTVRSERETITPVRDSSGAITHFIAVKEDLSDRDELLLQLRQAQKMESIGRLASGVAHDFNNLLTVIRGHAEMALGELPEGSPEANDVRGLLKGVERAAGLSRQLLAVSRNQRPDQQVLDLGGTVASMESLLRGLLPAHVEVHLDTGSDPTPIWADTVQLHQVLLNLAANAGDAISGGGGVTFSVGRRTISPEEAAALPWEVDPGPYAELVVTDTGEGMSPEIRDRIFEPFFSTKGEKEGTGLGLSIVFGIVKQCDGHIMAESEPGEGTSFRILFPMISGEAPGEEDAPAAETGVRGSAPQVKGSGTLLLVEDEDAIQRVVRRTLERAGYEVLVASDARTGLEMARRARSEIDLVISDVVMPGLGGAELVDGLRESVPDCPLILMSGYSEGELPEGVAQTATAFLAKPFSPEDLAESVLRALAPDREA